MEDLTDPRHLPHADVTTDVVCSHCSITLESVELVFGSGHEETTIECPACGLDTTVDRFATWPL
jgi:uncharacterized Zn finger protein